MSTEPLANGQRVLVVDDEEDIAYLLAVRLRGAGCAVRTANRAQEAMMLLEAEPADLAFLDVSMPGVTGLELLDWIRARELDMAVVLMTAFGSEEVAVDALRRGADDYLRKPFSTAELQAVLQRTLDVLRMRRQNARLREELAERAELMELQSLTDALTGLANRRAFDRSWLGCRRWRNAAATPSARSWRISIASSW